MLTHQDGKRERRRRPGPTDADVFDHSPRARVSRSWRHPSPATPASPLPCRRSPFSAKDEWGNLALPGTQITVDLSPSGHGGTLTPATQVGTTRRGRELRQPQGRRRRRRLRVQGDGAGERRTRHERAFQRQQRRRAVLRVVVLEHRVASERSVCVDVAHRRGPTLQRRVPADDVLHRPARCSCTARATGSRRSGSGGEIAVTGGNPDAEPADVRRSRSRCPRRCSTLRPGPPGSTTSASAPSRSPVGGAVEDEEARQPLYPEGRGARRGRRPNTRYWGIVPRCIWVPAIRASRSQLPADPDHEPLHRVEDASATGSGLGDLTIVLRKPYPWDGSGGHRRLSGRARRRPATTSRLRLDCIRGHDDRRCSEPRIGTERRGWGADDAERGRGARPARP